MPGSEKSATCISDGKDADEQCSICGVTITGSTISATGHNEQSVKYSAPTFDTEGQNEGKVCISCGATLSGCEVIPSINEGLVADDSKSIAISTDAYDYSKEFSANGDYVVSTVPTSEKLAQQVIKFTVYGKGTFSFDFRFISNQSSRLEIVHEPYIDSNFDFYNNGEIGNSWKSYNCEAKFADTKTVFTITYIKNTAVDSGLLIKNVRFSSGLKNVSITNESSNGTISTVIDGKTYPGDVDVKDISDKTVVTTTASAKPGYKFFGWADKKGNFVSFENPYVSEGINDINLVPVFDNENKSARIGKTLYTTLEDAVAHAVSGDTVYLVNTDYTVSSNLTVPADVTLVLPCGVGDYGYENDGFCPDGTTTNPSADLATCYSTLTIPSNVTLTVDGTLLVNAVTGRRSTSGSIYNISGGYSKIVNNGNIVVNNGAVLDCNGIIEGTGSVLANSGATIYETYAIVRWRGGTIALNTLQKGIFPIVETEMNSIKCTLRVNSGASLTGNVKVYAGGSYQKTKFPQIDNSNGIYRLSENAYVIRTIEQNRDVYNFYGGMTMSKSALTIVGQDLSTDFDPFTQTNMLYTVDGDMTYNLNNGEYNVSKGFKLLPGFEMNVADDAVLNIASDASLAFLSEKYLEIDSQFNAAGSTKYPTNRGVAQLNIKNGAVVNVYGTLAGNVSGQVMMMEGSADSIEISVMKNDSSADKYIESLIVA